MKIRLLAGAACLAISCFAVANPAAAEEEATSPITVSGSVAMTTDYRYRGVSMSDKDLAIQGGLTVSHDSGIYVGAWASNLAGWGTFGGSNTELDLSAGYSAEITSGVTADVGLVWIMFPGGVDTTDFAELHATISGDVGPVSVGVGVNYAPKQEALGMWYSSGLEDAIYDEGAKGDNFYVHGELGASIPDTPLSLNAHLGYSDGNAGLGPWGTSLAPTGSYLDWSLGASLDVGPVTLSATYIDTDLSRSNTAYLGSGLTASDGGFIADSTVVFTVSAGF